jgi:hypothetical protein
MFHNANGISLNYTIQTSLGTGDVAIQNQIQDKMNEEEDQSPEDEEHAVKDTSKVTPLSLVQSSPLLLAELTYSQSEIFPYFIVHATANCTSVLTLTLM